MLFIGKNILFLDMGGKTVWSYSISMLVQDIDLDMNRESSGKFYQKAYHSQSTIGWHVEKMVDWLVLWYVKLF